MRCLLAHEDQVQADRETDNRKRVEKTGDSTGTLTGDLTMHGETHPVTLDVTFNKMAPHPLPQYDNILTAGFSARGTIERAKWGVDAYVPAVGDEMRLIIEIEGQDKDAQQD